MIDLFLPQFNIAIEVDEAYHLGQMEEDKVRQKDIEVLNIDVKRIDCSKGIEEVNKQTDDIIELIKNMSEHVKAYDELSADKKEAYIDNELLPDWKVYKMLECNEKLMEIDKEIGKIRASIN